MSAPLSEKLEELSLMLVMTAAEDAAGIQILFGLVSELGALSASEAAMKPLSAACKALLSHSGSPDALAQIQAFSTQAQRFIENPTDSKVFLTNACSSVADGAAEVSADIDERFLAEFIETHSLLLQDFESSLLDVANFEGTPEEFTAHTKRYLHNIKGDAGSIGLFGIEKVSHTIEDILAETPATECIAMLLQFKEWVVEALKALTQGVNPKVSSETFLKSIELKGKATSTAEPEEKPSAPPLQTNAATPSSAATVADSGRVYSLQGEKEILVEFAAEAEEHLTSVEGVLLDAEGSFNRDAIDMIFRAVHSIKGGSAYFGLEEMTKCSHILENYLVEVREGARDLDKNLVALLLVYIDLQKQVLARAKKASQGDGKMTFESGSADFVESLHAYGRGEGSAVSPPPSSSESQVQAAPSTANQAARNDASDSKAGKVAVKSFVKVDTARLDQLIDSIGEMVIYSSMLIRHCRELLPDHERVMDSTHRVEKFSRELQDIGMSMRLVPIKGLFQKMSRLVWDTSKKLGKEVDFTMEGEDTELDRNLIDKLADPLMHMVRNSMDHGIESPDEREKKGKSRSGRVTLSAFHSGGSIHIRITDDGKGLNAEKLVAKAVEKGLVKAGQKLSDTEAFQLIFAAGFSTAAVVTDISGRGVGMDVVRRNVESLRGRIHIESKVDKGSTFTIELPLTLAIMDGVQIRVGTEHFLLPSLSIVEFIRAKPQMFSATLDKGETFHFRGKYLPVYRLANLYHIDAEFNDTGNGTVVIVENGSELVALMVDEIVGECSTVIKSLGAMFGSDKGFAGCSIMPGGNVALILDIRSLVELARSSYHFDQSKTELAQVAPPNVQVMH